MSLGLKPGLPLVPSGVLAGTPRIVILDDEPGPRNSHKVLLGIWFKQAVFVEFEDGNAGWEELSHTDPDLLITDYSHPGLPCDEMLGRLAAKKVKYPIIISSAYVGFTPKLEQRLREQIGNDLHVYFLHKPFVLENLRIILETAFGIGMPLTEFQ